MASSFLTGKPCHRRWRHRSLAGKALTAAFAPSTPAAKRTAAGRGGVVASEGGREARCSLSRAGEVSTCWGRPDHAGEETASGCPSHLAPRFCLRYRDQSGARGMRAWLRLKPSAVGASSAAGACAGLLGREGGLGDVRAATRGRPEPQRALAPSRAGRLVSPSFRGRDNSPGPCPSSAHASSCVPAGSTTNAASVP